VKKVNVKDGKFTKTFYTKEAKDKKGHNISREESRDRKQKKKHAWVSFSSSTEGKFGRGGGS